MSEWIDLTQDIHPAVDKMEFLPCPETELLSEQSETSLQITHFSMAVHTGTHIDAPIHAVADGKDVAEFDAEKWYREGTVADVDVGPKEPIELSDVEPATDRIDPGEVLVVRTGWQKHIGTDTYADHPYFSQDLADWLVEMDVAWVGMDFLTPDMPPELRPEGFTYPIHTTLLENEVLIVENLTNVAALPERFTIAAAPLPIRGSDGSPVRAFARPL